MLSDEDKSWIAENLLRGGSPLDLIEVLAAAGRNRALVESEMQNALGNPYLAGARRSQDVTNRRLLKAWWVLDALYKLALQSGEGLLLSVEERLESDRFYREYYFRNRPVVIRGAVADWPARRLWTMDYLRQNWGNVPVNVQAGRESSKDFETQAEQHTCVMRFADFIDLVQAGPSNDIYMTARNSDANRVALAGLWNDIDDIGNYLSPTNPRAGFFWFGPKGTLTPNHHDLTNNLMAQVLGRKRILLADVRHLPRIYNHLHVFSNVDMASIDLERFPDMRNVQILSAEIGPGDILFLPVGWWHQVEALDISITMTFTKFHVDNDFSSFYRSNGSM